MEQALTFLYSLGAVITAISYMPQIWRLLNDKSHADSISLQTYGLWVYATSVSFLYATLINGDIFFMLSTGCCFAGCTTITLLVLFNRHLKDRVTGGEAMSIIEIFNYHRDVRSEEQAALQPVPVRTRTVRRWGK